MKKLFGILFLGLLWSNCLSAKILNIENKIKLDVPTSHEFVKIDKQSMLNSGVFSDLETFINQLDELQLNFYIVGPKKLTDVVKLLLDGEDPENLDMFQDIMKRMEKKANTIDFEDPRKLMSWAAKEIKRLMKKEKVEFYTYVITSDQKYTSLDDEEFNTFISNYLDMTNSELALAEKELRKVMTELAGDNKTILFNEEVSLIIKKFKIKKISNNQLVVNANFVMDYLGAVKLPWNLFFTVKNDKMYFIVSECWINCSKQVERFDKMVKPILLHSQQNQKISVSVSADDDLIEQLNDLNELYKSGVLTKDEFTKAKKKLLN